MNKNEIQKRNIIIDVSEEDMKHLIAGMGLSVEYLFLPVPVNTPLYIKHLKDNVDEVIDLCNRLTITGLVAKEKV